MGAGDSRFPRTSDLGDAGEGAALGRRAHELIPGGAHTYAKGDDQFPDPPPSLIARGAGCHVWDVDGNEFIEYGMGLRAVTLGHAYPPVVEAVQRQLVLGSNYTRPAKVEVECAEIFLDLIEPAEMVKFCKDGSTANNAALTLARAYTGRDLVAICADHPFFSTAGWFIGTTPMNRGIPQAIRDLTVGFKYNDLAAVEELFAAYPEQIACLVLEPEKGEPPRDGYLVALQELCHRNGALLVLDEMITGFRLHAGGAQTLYGLTPDLSTFGKGMANGFSVSALAGKREIMELGGLRYGGDRVFLLSTTHGGEAHSLAAAVATMTVYRNEPVIQTLYDTGRRLRDEIGAIVSESGVEGFFEVVGREPNLAFATRDAEGVPSQAFRTLFLQEMMDRGFIVPSFVVSYSHGERDVAQTIEAVRGSLLVYRDALEHGVENYLRGRSVRPVFRRRN